LKRQEKILLRGSGHIKGVAEDPKGRGLSIYQFSKSYFVFPVSIPCFNKPEDRRKVFCASLDIGDPSFLPAPCGIK